MGFLLSLHHEKLKKNYYIIIMGLLEGKTALVTGAARGIGKAIALKFASEGADVAFTDLVINDAAQETIKELEAFGHKVKGYASNAADFEQTHEVVGQILADFGRIDILVNNAGITKDGLMLRMSEAQWDAVINVNLKSAFNFIHAVTPVMARQRGGSIINMSSVVGVSGNAGQCNYSASKAGMIGLAKSIAKEMGPRGIRANCIAPGRIVDESGGLTSEDAHALSSKAEADPEDEIIEAVTGHYATAKHVAELAIWLASENCYNTTGQTIYVGGGEIMPMP